MRPSDWIQLYSGTGFYPTRPELDRINITDIAHSLALQCRYNGHCKWHYSVAQHSYYISLYLPPELALAGLLHDAHEAYLTDVVKPLKPHIALYKDWERAIDELLEIKFGVNLRHPLIKEADIRILANERDQIMMPSEWQWGLTAAPLEGLVIEKWQPEVAEEKFLARFHELYRP